MPNAYILKDYDGGAERTSLSAAMTATATSFSVVDGSTYPSGTLPFVVVIDRGLASEEKLLCDGRINNSINVVERAYDGSSAQSHALGAVVEHALDAFTIEQANRYVNLQQDVGDLVVHDGTSPETLAVGADGLVLLADSTETLGVRWGQVTEDSIAEAAIDSIISQVTASLPSGDLPTGMVVPFAGSGAPGGWLVCDGTLKSTTTYAALFAVIGYTYGGSGSSFGLPNMKGRVPVGLDSGQTEFNNLNVTGGAKTHTLTVAELASHTHTGSTNSTGSHDHSYQDHPRDTSLKYAAGTAGADRDAVSDSTGSAGNHSHTITMNNTGSGTPHNNLQPYIVLNYIIKA